MSRPAVAAPAGGDVDAEESGCAVLVRDLGCRVAGRAVLDGVDLAVPPDSRYALIGQNGTGKSLLLRLLAGRATPEHGPITVFDTPVGAATVAETGSAPRLDHSGTGRQAVARCATARDPEPFVVRALDRVGLTARADAPVAEYPAGDLRWLTIAAALVNPCALLLLDDPFDGLDAAGTARLARLCKELTADGVTLVLASRPHPVLDEIATHAGVLSRGRIIAQGPMREVRAALPSRVAVRTPDVILALGVLRGLGVSELRTHGERLSGLLGDVPIDRVVRGLVHGGVRVLEAEPVDEWELT